VTKMQVYDPPMCCSTGVCGPKVDPVLPRFAGDLAWLEAQGVGVERFNLSQEPTAFAQNATVAGALRDKGEKVLPLVLVDGRVVAEGTYPSRETLAALSGLVMRTAELAVEPTKACNPKNGCC
jgi:hypothetical protein